MSCRDFEPLLVESARAGAPDSARAADGKTALEHAASCPACGHRLQQERELTSGLRALAASSAAQQPPVGSEAILLAAYRAERGREVHTHRWILALSGALAASLVVLLGAALMLSRESGSLVRALASRLSSRPQVASPPPFESAGENGSAFEQEEVTDFVAFYPGADVGSLDSGALVRVRMPSSALGSFGLAAAQGREEQWVSADLLVAEDGSPQAIRFVRPAPEPKRN